MSIGKLRGILYLLAKLLGDISAISNGTVAERVKNRAVGRVLSGLFRRN